MDERLTIGQVAARSGLPIKTIRFYEEQAVIPPPARSPGGYRLYTPLDLRRLRLVRLAKLLGLSLPEIQALVTQAFASACEDFADELLTRIAAQEVAVDQRIAELTTFKRELFGLAAHVAHSRAQLTPGQRVAGCDFCPILDVDVPPIEAAQRRSEGAGSDRPLRERDERIVADVVCGMAVNPDQAAGTSAYQGATYAFCSPGCKQQFDQDPRRYVGQVTTG